MNVILELGSEEVAALQHRAEAEGVNIQTVLHRLIAQIAPVPETRKALEKQLWRGEEEADDSEELAEREREREEVRANLNRWRAEQGQPPSEQ